MPVVCSAGERYVWDAVQVFVSWAAVAAFAFGALPALVATTGWAGLVKFWLMPWLGAASVPLPSLLRTLLKTRP